MRAAARHDDGCKVWEAAPRVDPRTRRPYQFTDLPAGEHLSFYRQGIADVLKRDPYAGLLVSMHLSGLHQRRFGTESRPTPRPAGPSQDAAALRRCQIIAVDSKEQARLEAGDFQQPLEDGSLHWADIRELGQVIVGRYPARRHPQDVTLFKSLGIAVEDIAVAGRVYQKAVAEGAGKTVEW